MQVSLLHLNFSQLVLQHTNMGLKWIFELILFLNKRFFEFMFLMRNALSYVQFYFQESVKVKPYIYQSNHEHLVFVTSNSEQNARPYIYHVYC